MVQAFLVVNCRLIEPDILVPFLPYTWALDIVIEMRHDELERLGWKKIASTRADSEGRFKVGITMTKPGRYKFIATETDENGNIVQSSNRVDVFVRKPSGSCPKCYSATYLTGKSRRIPFKLKASLGKNPEIGKEWKYEKEHQCIKCRRKFPQSLILPYEE